MAGAMPALAERRCRIAKFVRQQIEYIGRAASPGLADI
jgi:hypothetical protein